VLESLRSPVDQRRHRENEFGHRSSVQEAPFALAGSPRCEAVSITTSSSPGVGSKLSSRAIGLTVAVLVTTSFPRVGPLSGQTRLSIGDLVRACDGAA
jgi:hypothetical protein